MKNDDLPHIDKLELGLNKLFSNFQYLDFSLPILAGKLHPDIHNDFLRLAYECRETLNHPDLGFLKHHHNVGANAGQTAIPITKILDSNLHAYMIGLATYFMHQRTDKSYSELWSGAAIQMAAVPYNKESSWWFNLADSSSENLPHVHPCTFTTVVYVKNCHVAPTVFYDSERNETYEHWGKDGEVVILPGWVFHGVGKFSSDETRITAACNINKYSEDSALWSFLTDFETIL